MRVMVLGGTRFIGAEAVRLLVAAGHDVAVFHRGKTETALPGDVHHIHGDRRELPRFASAFRDFSPDVALDMMATTEADGRLVIDTLSDIARRAVVISSCDVYRAYDRFRKVDPGAPDPVPLTEDSPLRPRLYPYREDATDPADFRYHYEKILVERVVMSAPRLPACVLRLPMVYGPGDYQHRLYPYLKRMDDGRPAILLARDFARWRGLRGYVEDMAHAVVLCVTSEQSAGHIYHVGEVEHATEAEWVARIARAAGWQGEILAVPNPDLPEHLRHEYDTAQHWCLDSTRIRSELGYAEATPPAAAMDRTVGWERANPPATIDASDFDYAAEDLAIAAARAEKGK